MAHDFIMELLNRYYMNCRTTTDRFFPFTYIIDHFTPFRTPKHMSAEIVVVVKCTITVLTSPTCELVPADVRLCLTWNI